MTEQEYKQKRRECFVKFCKDNGIDQEVNISIFDAFDQIFDRAYALGKQKETITQEEIEKVAKEYVLTRQQARHNAKREEDATLRDFGKTIKAWDAFDMEQAYEDGANFALGKQEKDAEGEKMLTAMKWKVQEQYVNYNKELQHDGLRHIEYEKAKEVVKVLYYLFGSKCLRDETCNVASKEPNPAEEYDVFNDPEPKCLHFKDGKCAHPAVAHLENGKLAKGADCDVSSCEDVEYEPNPAEPKEEADEHFDTIVKGGFRNERRLNIAAQITASIYANDKAASQFDSIEALVRKALDIADALIAECEEEATMTKYYFMSYMFDAADGQHTASCTCKAENPTLKGLRNLIAKYNDADAETVVIISIKDLTKKEYEMLNNDNDD